MTKTEFLQELKQRIQEYPVEETEKSMEYYAEMIDDRMEDGMTEAEAIASLGSVEQIAEQIKCELPITTLVKQKTKEKTQGKRMPVWAIILLIVGFPLWGSVLIMILAFIIVFYALIWVADVMLWCNVLCMGVMSFAGIIGFFGCLFQGAFGSALLYLGMSLFMAGVGVLAFLGSLLVTKGIFRGTRWCFLQIKKALIRKEEA